MNKEKSIEIMEKLITNWSNVLSTTPCSIYKNEIVRSDIKEGIEALSLAIKYLKSIQKKIRS